MKVERFLGKNTLYAAMAVIVALTSSCATPTKLRLYDGAQLEKEKVALITPTPGYNGIVNGRQDVYILRVDGRELSPKERDSHAVLEVMPGEHTLAIAAMLQRGSQRVAFDDPKPLQYKFEGGKNYSIFCKMESGATPDQTIVRFWMEDETGKLVSGNN